MDSLKALSRQSFYFLDHVIQFFNSYQCSYRIVKPNIEKYLARFFQEIRENMLSCNLWKDHWKENFFTLMDKSVDRWCELELNFQLWMNRLVFCRYFCDAKKEWVRSLIFPFYLGVVFVFVVMIPTATNAFCYGRALYYLYGPNKWNVPIRNSVTETKQLHKLRTSTTKFAIAIVFSYFFCWLPYFILAFISVFCDVQTPEWSNTLTEGLAMGNSLINPLLYCGYSLSRKVIFIQLSSHLQYCSWEIISVGFKLARFLEIGWNCKKI